MTDIAEHIKVEPKRDRWGRYLIGGKSYTRVTTFAATTDDRFNLEAWKQRMVAAGLVARPDLYAQAAAHIDDKKRLNKLCDEAVEAAKGSAGANLGTALHTFTEQVDAGLTPIIPEPWDADIAAYQQTLAAAGVHVSREFIERIVVRHDLGVAGTFDRLVTIDGWPLPVIADLKTGNLEHASAFGAIAVQLACYAHADDLYDPATDTLTPMPAIDRTRALVIHLPAGQATCTLHVIDTTAGWEAAQLCGAVREWRRRKDLAAPFTSTVAPLAPVAAVPVGEPAPVERVAWLTNRLTSLRTTHPDAFAQVAAGWPAGVPTLKHGGHTADQLQVVVELISMVEARHEVPFGDPDPLGQPPGPEVRAALVARLKALPADVLAVVEAQAKEFGVPNVNGRKFTAAHLPVVESLLADAERAVQSTNPVHDTQQQRTTAA